MINTAEARFLKATAVADKITGLPVGVMGIHRLHGVTKANANLDIVAVLIQSFMA